MFERFEFTFAEYTKNFNDDKDWYQSANFLIVYDKEKNKTYCYHRNEIKGLDEVVSRFVLQGNDLILDLENCYFRECKRLEKRCSTFGQSIKWKMKYNDKNKPSKVIFYKEWCYSSFLLSDFSIIKIFCRYSIL